MVVRGIICQAGTDQLRLLGFIDEVVLDLLDEKKEHLSEQFDFRSLCGSFANICP